MDIELLHLIVILGIFLIGAAYFKIPIGVAMMLSAFGGIFIYSAISAPDQFLQIPRHLVDGSFAYIEPMLTIVAAMIFMRFFADSGALESFTVLAVEKLYRFPTVLLIIFMIIIMFPAMITGSSVTSIVSAGALVAPTLLALGIPKTKTAGIVVCGSIFGMIAPPINLPVMIIADTVDMPYTGFTLPLLILTVPLAIFCVLFLGRRYVGKIDIEDVKKKIPMAIKDEVNTFVYIPILVLIVLLVIVNVFPTWLPPIGLPLVFLIPALIQAFLGRKFNIVTSARNGVRTALPVMAVLVGIGMFIQAMTLTGVRGYIVYNILALGQVTWGQHPILLYLGSLTLIPAVGAFSPLGSASVFGGPYVLVLLFLNEIVVAAALSMFTGVGDFIPPSVVALHSTHIVELDGYGKILKTLIVPIAVTIVVTLAYMILMGMYW